MTRPQVIIDLLAVDDTGVVANYIRKLEADLTACRAQGEALRRLEDDWRRAAATGREQAIAFAARSAFDSASYERGKSDARFFCAGALAAALSSTPTEPKEIVLAPCTNCGTAGSSDGVYKCPECGWTQPAALIEKEI